MASALSLTAIAMSETSALVGVGWFIMLSSMLVATITGFDMLRHVLIMSSCDIVGLLRTHQKDKKEEEKRKDKIKDERERLI